MEGQFLEYFFGEDDARYFASLGLNCIRLPVSGRPRSFRGMMELKGIG